MNDKEKIIIPRGGNGGLVAITEQQHNDYMKVIEEKMESEMRLRREEVGNVQK